jgi:TonB-linked SusC/RagA family outer membrane protein
MAPDPRQRVRRRSLLTWLFALVVPSLAAAQTGTITGKVTDEVGGAPLEASRVILTGTTRIETTNREGGYTFREVQPGTYQVRVLRVGYRPATDSVTVAAGAADTADFAMAAAPVQLDEIVTTATGEQRKLEVGNVVTTIDAGKVAETAPITEFSNLLSGRAAGVQVLKSSGTTGEGTRIRIRGSNSISLSNEPLYYLDGVRLESAASSTTLNVGGFSDQSSNQGPSRINDIDPDDIESIEIVKGPAAATLYGIQASNGVVRITTKHGTAGPPRWNLFSELGSVSDNNQYPVNYYGRVDSLADPVGFADGFDGFCTIQSQLDGACILSQLQTNQPLNNADTRPYEAGLRQSYGANVSGGSDQVTYYISGGYENEQGPFRLPKFEEDSIRSALGSVPGNQIRPNALEKYSVRGNVHANISPSFDVDASLGFVTNNTRLIENDNSFLTVNGSGTASGVLPEDNRGWFFIPAELFAELAQQEANRFTTGFTGNWRPLHWLTTRATVGYDIVNRTDVQFFPTGQVADFGANRAGVRSQNRFDISQTSVDLAASAKFQLTTNVGSRTSIGGQWFRDLSRGNFSTGRGLPAGSGTISGASTFEASDTLVESRSIGTYIEEEIDLKQRLFLTGAVRFDDNSAFGKNFNATAYPKASASWLMSDEPFFDMNWLNTLRLRAAYGASGQQPGTTDALRFYRAVSGKKDEASTTGITFGSLGNPDLKPERSDEFEIGFDAGMFKDRLSLELTYYDKLTKDALIERPVAPSLGASRTQFVNLSRIKNHGFELAITTRVIDSKNTAWDLTVSGSTTTNRIEDLGAGVSPIFVGFYQQHRTGYPAGGFWAPTIHYNDANQDGIIDISEVSLSDSAVFRGSAIPTKEASLNSNFAIFGGQIVLGTQVDYRGGHLVDNSLEQFRCFSIGNCRGLYDKTAPLSEQARAQATFLPGAGNSVAFLEPGWFIKLREVSLTFQAPDKWARAFRASRLSLTIAGRNLGTITDYTGVDPEVNAFAQNNFASSDFESQAQVRYWTARLNVGF